eukprot:8841907-Pyramimonas_sp.AAC.1
MFRELWSAGASAKQVLALARDCQDLSVNLNIPGVAQASDVKMRRAMRTGGKYEPKVFVLM